MKAYYDANANLDVLRGKTLGIVGNGNQGRAREMARVGFFK